MTLADASNVLVIGCDESGSEGETLVASQHPVFVHASVNLPAGEAEDLRDWMRAETRTQASEMKSKTALLPRNRRVLFQALDRLSGAANITLVDKAYFLTSKLVETLVGPHAEQWGTDIGRSGFGRALAEVLDRRAPASVGISRWDALLSSYNSLVRSHRRQGAEPPTVGAFFSALEDALRHSTDDDVREALTLVWDSRMFAHEYQGRSEVEFRELDPLMPTMSGVARNWAMRIGDAPFTFLADTYSGLTPVVRDYIVEASRMPLAVGGYLLPKPNLRGISLEDSREDARIQLADILAGIGREVARMAMEGTFDDDLQVAIHEMLDNTVMASDGSPLDVLIDRRPIAYRDEWVATHWGM
ncbi:hypothetical protein ACTJKH_07375 [Microbacterium sp. 22215]|uniref:hypothetical protein n=1 Tax=Microbacterium sp. 22215 TaxID=3453893 RepID=UPI003F866DD5